MTTTTTRSVTVDREPAAVADYVLDFTTSAEWDPHTVSCRRLDAGPLAVGAEYENVQRLLGHDAPLRYRVVEFEPGHRLVLEGGGDTVWTRDEITVTTVAGGGARVEYAVTAGLQGVARLGEPLLGLALDRVADDGEEQLRRVLETRCARTG